MHCQAINGVPQPPQSLPVTWANVSNFNCLPDAELAKYNWFPFVQTIQPDYNPATQRISQRLEFDGTKVTGKWDVVALTAAEIAAAQAALVIQYETALYRHQDEMAGRKGYRNFDRCVGYYNSTNATWARDAQDISKWRDDCVIKSFDIINKVQTGQMALPSISDYLAMMPPLWPDPNATPPATGGNGNGTGNGTLS